MRVQRFVFRTTLSPDECRRLLHEQSERQCAMFETPFWPFLRRASWRTYPVQSSFDGDSFELSIPRRGRSSVGSTYALKGRLAPDPSGQGTTIDCTIVCDLGARIALLIVAAVFAGLYRRGGKPSLLTYSTPEELRQVIVRMLVICAFVAVACIGLPLFLGAWDKGVLVDFLKETLQAST